MPYIWTQYLEIRLLDLIVYQERFVAPDFLAGFKERDEMGQQRTTGGRNISPMLLTW